MIGAGLGQSADWGGNGSNAAKIKHYLPKSTRMSLKKVKRITSVYKNYIEGKLGKL